MTGRREDEIVDVLVIGGGIGGLALAAGLRRAGIGVTVIERDTDLAATGGYHITLQRPVQEALAALLPPEIFERLLASAADGRRRDPDVLWDPRGRRIGVAQLKSDDPGIDIDRITLRALLAEAVGDALQRGRTCVGHRREGTGVVVELDDGTSLSGDVLVGAEGVHSAIARQLAGGPTSQPTGLVGISGRTPVAALEPADQERLGVRSSLGVGPRATALYFGYLDPVGHAVIDRADLRASITTEPTFIWGAMVRESEQTKSLARLAGPALRDATADLLRGRGWTPAMTDVITRTDPDSVGLFRFHAAPLRARDQAPWPAGNVTALGDAVHATPPTAGMGAGAAVRDAADLARELAGVVAGDKALSVAVRDFESGMRERGATVIEAAMSTVRQILVTDTPIGAAATTVSLPVMAALSALRRKV